MGCWTRCGMRAEFMSRGSDKSILYVQDCPRDDQIMCGNRVHCFPCSLVIGHCILLHNMSCMRVISRSRNEQTM